MDYWQKNQEERAARVEWLAQLKVGDEVAVFDRGSSWSRWAGVPSIRKVSSVTRTIVRIEGLHGEAEFRREDGGGCGSTRGEIKPVTDDMRTAIRLNKALDEVERRVERRVDKLTRAKWKGVDADLAEKILSLLPEVTP